MDIKNWEGKYRTLLIRQMEVKARCAASGHNSTVQDLVRSDLFFTLLNFCVPIIIFSMGFALKLKVTIGERLGLDSNDLVVIGSAGLIATSFFQGYLNQKVRALEHRKASCEFETFAERIAIDSLWEVEIDSVKLGKEYADLQRGAPHITERQSRRARKHYKLELDQIYAKIRELRMAER